MREVELGSNEFPPRRFGCCSLIDGIFQLCEDQEIASQSERMSRRDDGCLICAFSVSSFVCAWAAGSVSAHPQMLCMCMYV